MNLLLLTKTSSFPLETAGFYLETGLVEIYGKSVRLNGYSNFRVEKS